MVHSKNSVNVIMRLLKSTSQLHTHASPLTAKYDSRIYLKTVHFNSYTETELSEF